MGKLLQLKSLFAFLLEVVNFVKGQRMKRLSSILRINPHLERGAFFDQQVTGFREKQNFLSLVLRFVFFF